MRNHVIARLAAANPVPTGAPIREPELLSSRRSAIAGALVLAATLPAVAFAGDLGDLLGISNDGTAVATSSVLPGESRLDKALQQMSIGPTMQSLGTLNGVAFYAARNANGDFCLALDHVDAAPKGVLCDLNDDNFPSAEVKAISFPRALQGVAADGVASVELVDDGGTVLDSAPVFDNLFVSDRASASEPVTGATYLEALDASGSVLTRQALPR